MIGKHWLLLLLILVATTPMALACGEEEEEMVKVKLALDWYPNANHAGLYIAQEKG